MKKYELSYKDLKNFCNPNVFKFETTEESNDSDLIYGQDRGIKALEFGLSGDSKGYNLYVEGPSIYKLYPFESTLRPNSRAFIPLDWP